MIPKVSIILPTYNRIGSLHFAINSVRWQSFDDWELILVDDASNDWTKEYYEVMYREKDERIRYFRLDENTGSPVGPRNYGVLRARAEKIAFLDSDDQWCRPKLENQYWYMVKTGSVFTYHDLRVTYQNRTEKWSKMATCHSDNIFNFLLRKNFIATSSVMMDRDLYDMFNGMNVHYKVSHDWDLWLKIAYSCPVHYINEVMGTLHIHKEGSVINANHQRRKESREIVRSWRTEIDGMYYRKIMVYYYLIEVFDHLPYFMRSWVRRKWYSQEKYK